MFSPKHIAYSLTLGLIVLLGVSCSADTALATYLEANRASLTEPADSTGQAVEFVVAPGTPARTIAEILEAEGLITDARLFEAYVRVNGLAQGLDAGTHTLSAAMTPIEIAETLQHAVAPSFVVRAPEGWRLEQIASELNRTGLLDGETYLRLAMTGQAFDSSIYTFLDERPVGSSLEGYLFPDSYELHRQGASAHDLVERQLQTFAERVLPQYEAAVNQGLTELSLHEVLTVASIVEREAVVDEERPRIAAVYLNRLSQDMKLDADPTVQYAMGYQPGARQWWKTPMYLEEYGSVDSPYNTYLNPGLPPGPIAAPSLHSIQAVLNPDRHDYLYFVAVGDGSGLHVFSETYKEHVKNVKKYLQK